MKCKKLIAIILTAGALACAQLPAWAPDAFSEGLALFNAGKWPQAAAQFAEAASRNPNDVVVRVTAGVALASLRRYPEALAQFEAAARLSPNSVLPCLLLDGTYSELGNAARAREARDQANRILGAPGAFGAPESSDTVLTKSLVKHPENAIAHSLLGDMYQLQGKLDLAKGQYVKATQLAPGWAKPVFNLGMANLQTDAKAAESNFAQALKLDPSNGRTYLWMGDAYLHQGRYGDAIAAYRKAGRDKVLASEAQTRIGNAELRAGDYRSASEQFDQAAKQAPQDPRPIAGQAQVYQNIGKLEEAEGKYKQAAKVMASNQAPPPSQAVVQQQIAVVRSQMGRQAEAVDSLKAGYDLHPTLENAAVLVEAEKEMGKLADGLARNEAQLKRDSNNRTALVYLLAAYKANGNITGLISVAERLARLDLASAYLYFAEVGAAHMRQGNIESATAAYMRAMDAGSASTWAETARHAKGSGALSALEDRCGKAFATSRKRSTGVVLFEIKSAKGDAAGMVETASRLVELFPDDSALWLRLGQAYEQSGEKQLALTAYARAAAGSDPQAAAAARVRVQEMSK